MSNEILILLHPEKQPNTPNPGLTANGHSQIQRIVECINPSQAFIAYVGIGKRHIETLDDLKACGVTIRQAVFLPTVGVTASRSTDKQSILLADGTRIPANDYNNEFEKSAFLAFIQTLQPPAIVITSRPRIKPLGVANPKSGELYSYNRATHTLSCLFSI